MHDLGVLRDGPLEKLWWKGRGGGGGGEGKYKKKNWRKGKLNEKNSRTPVNPKQYSFKGVKKKIHTRNTITKTNSRGMKIPHPHKLVRP